MSCAPGPSRGRAASAIPRAWRGRWRAAGLAAGALALLGVAADVLHAQSGGSFAITRSTVDSGAGASNAAPYGVRWTSGQPDAGYASGGVFAVRGGFWGSRSNPPTDSIFDHGFE